MSAEVLNVISYCLLGAIAIVAIAAYVYVQNLDSNKLLKKRRWIESIPSFISTFGVLGTFAGITIGLMNFNTSDLNNSIPLLLSGLKTAFFTSLAGMIGSLVLSRKISCLYDKEDGGVSDINMAASRVVTEITGLKSKSDQMFTLQQEFFKTLTTELSLMHENSIQVAHTLALISNESKVQSQHESEIAKNTQDLGRNVDEMSQMIEAITNINQETSDEVKSFGTKLHGEVIEIVDAMDKTNVMLEQKFEEFTDLLKKSNTEALVDVMKKVTEEFQKQMNSLIQKLVQENFEQLNNSVENLVLWQKENKDMISSLTAQYKAMTNEFEETGTTLTKVGNDTRNLVSDGGRLKQIVEALNAVMVKDEKFIEITKNLTNAAEKARLGTQEFENSSRLLEVWLQKQRNFVDGVQLLIGKLDELNRLRNYNEQFWQSTKQSMEEGVGIISAGSRTLNEQLKHLDEQFYSRLNTTLAELDTCIQAMVNGNTRR